MDGVDLGVRVEDVREEAGVRGVRGVRRVEAASSYRTHPIFITIPIGLSGNHV